MANLYTILPGNPVAELAAAHILSQLQGDARARAVVFVPTRRAAVSMRRAFQKVLKGEASLLPRILPLADSGEALLTVLGTQALPVLSQIPPAMSSWRQRYMLAAQVAAFLKRRHGHVTMDYPLALAEELMALEDQCARAGVQLTHENLRQIGGGAEHWEQALQFLGILAEHWPSIEQEMGVTTKPRRDVLILEALANAWKNSPPEHALYVVGSTASQESTAALLQVIAQLPQGAVILPGIDPAMDVAEWNSIASGHPLYHLKHFLDRFPLAPRDIKILGPGTRNVWQQALAATDAIPEWSHITLAPHQQITLLPCAHPEAEARAIALLMRESLETPGKRTALITPDEGLMTRVAAQMKRYGVTIDRLDKGTLAESDLGSLWTVLMAALAEPERLIHIRALLHHRLVKVDAALLSALEPYWYGVSTRRVGQMPKLPEAVRVHSDYPSIEQLVKHLARLSRANLSASEWVAESIRLLSPFMAARGAADEAVQDILESIDDADLLGPLAVREFISLLGERLADPQRHGGVAAHPCLVMLTPVEARLEQFDRVILGSMTEDVWPGITPPNAWLNLAAQAALGLPPPTHHVSLMAHDMLMLGSAPEVFLSWPARDSGSPTQRSRFIERLVTLLKMHGIDEDTITAREYVRWSDEVFVADGFAPAKPPAPTPARALRPARLPVSVLDTLFRDPYTVYAKHVLGLRKLEEIDAEAEASDFGSLAHKAIHQLTLHWNETNRPASADEIAAMAEAALREFSDKPSTALFWRTRLLRALTYVNGVEETRRESPALAVQPELSVESALALPGGEGITLVGKIDRLEEGAQNVIADYKTGEIPKPKDILAGNATQLLAYAMLVGAPDAIEYWRLPHGKHAGETLRVPYDELEQAALPQKLKAALAMMLDAKTPFLADASDGSDYDGISRYDEWAG